MLSQRAYNFENSTKAQKSIYYRYPSDKFLMTIAIKLIHKGRYLFLISCTILSYLFNNSKLLYNYLFILSIKIKLSIFFFVLHFIYFHSQGHYLETAMYTQVDIFVFFFVIFSFFFVCLSNFYLRNKANNFQNLPVGLYETKISSNSVAVDGESLRNKE